MDLERHSIKLGKRPGLVIVDVVKGFTDPACPLGTDCPDVVEANRQLLDAFRARDLPVFFTTVIYRTEDIARVFRERVPALNVLTPGSDWVKVDPRIAPLPGETIIEKQWASSFFKTDLDDRLKAAGADSLVVTGLTTSGCVRATVLDGLQNDYPVVVPREAVGDRNPDAHAANLFDMHAKYADVMSLEETLALLPERE
ncbi:isochorismatase family protein [Emcibacter nanhaiensis]|uniref:Isochorismatase family protein n=1 Tax=Emcibacter nanhaiensis TaxID=1505037 RepID=A0A501PSU8_9PROT|nr:isochorismatase family protein [Emcibacter nanhaiensis]TPD63228.1 isochorismatase family protein [Emcibacter nanhaiensis]